jgi:hypothetical protein
MIKIAFRPPVRHGKGTQKRTGCDQRLEVHSAGKAETSPARANSWLRGCDLSQLDF